MPRHNARIFHRKAVAEHRLALFGGLVLAHIDATGFPETDRGDPHRIAIGVFPEPFEAADESGQRDECEAVAFKSARCHSGLQDSFAA